MKHISRFAALMTAAAIFAFLPGAQVCGQSRRGGGGGHSGGGSHSSSISRSSSGSHSGGSTYSHGGSYSSGRSGGSISRSSGSASRPSSSTMSRPSGSSSSSGQVSRQSRPSGGSSASRSGSSTLSRPSGSSSSSGQVNRQPRPSTGGGSVNQPAGGARRSGGYHDGAYGNSRPSGNSAPGRGGSDDVRNRAGAVSGGSHPAPAGGSNARPAPGRDSRPHADGARRPGVGSRPYADGSYNGRPAPGRVSMNNRPGGHPHRPPVHREYAGRPTIFHHAGHHHYGHYIPSPPPRYRLYHYWGRDYYFWDDIWYRYYGGRYWISRPPFGYVFTPLADAVFTACEFAYYFDRIHYYNTVNENAQTIAAQNETIAANNAVIASQNERIARGTAMAQASGDLASSLGLVQSYASASTEYYYNDGVFYVKGADGQYTVIVPPAGALVETLPDDYEIVELGGGTYYKVDDTIYRMVVIEGKACFEVLGQMIS